MRAGWVYLVGAGPGDPGLLTVRGLELLRKAEAVIYDRLVNPVLLNEAPPEALRIFVGKLVGSHSLAQGQINALLIAHARRGRSVVRLKGGDPFVFGRGGEEAEALAKAGIPFEVVPGVTSAVAVPAYAGIPLTHRTCSSSVAIVTGTGGGEGEMSGVAWDKLATGVDTLVVLMPVRRLPEIAGRLLAHGRSRQTPAALIRWGTKPEQETIAGTLEDIADRASAAGIQPPATLIVGEVVRLREMLSWFEERIRDGDVAACPERQGVPRAAGTVRRGRL